MSSVLEILSEGVWGTGKSEVMFICHLGILEWSSKRGLVTDTDLQLTACTWQVNHRSSSTESLEPEKGCTNRI